MNDPRLDIAIDALQKIIKATGDEWANPYVCETAKETLAKIKTMRGKPCADCAKKNKRLKK